MREPAQITASPPGATDLCSYAFGVSLLGHERLPELLTGPVPDAGRRATVTIVERPAIDAGWPAGEARRILDRRLPDGSPFMSIDQHPVAGYRIEVYQHTVHGIACGAHRVACDGRSWSAWLPRGPAWRWQRLVFAQILPAIATLQGLALFHSSAVAVGNRVYGLLAPSGTGKSSIASHLVAGGASFFTDDVLALEAEGSAVIAHPGPQFSNVHAHELATLPAAQRARIGTPLGESDKHHLRPRGTPQPLPLGGMFFLERVPAAIGVRTEHAQDPTRRLLASAFAPHFESADRLLGQLDVCSAIANLVPLHCVAIGTDVTAREVASVIAELTRAR